MSDTPPFEPGPPRELIEEDEMPAEEDLPEILAYLEQAGLEAEVPDAG